MPKSESRVRRFGALLSALGALIVSPSDVSAATRVAGVISSDTTWEAAGNPYVMSDDVTVDHGVTLILSAGVVVQAHLETELVVLGRLVAHGRASAPIILTSYPDDAVVGDTNRDGSETTARAGDWVGIGFHGSREGSVLEFVEVHYAGYYGPTGTNYLEPTAEPAAESPAGEPKREHADTAVASRVQSACGSCHLRPPADILPREMWPAEVERMAGMRDEMPFERIPAFSKREISDWYQKQAPANFVLKESLASSTPGPLRFDRRGLALQPGGSPHVATVVRLDAGTIDPEKSVLASANMKNGSIHLLSFDQRPRLIGTVAGHPVRAVAGDIDADGLSDLIISDVGSVSPTDDLVGRVVVALNRGEGSFEFQTVMDGLPRVADARPVDLDGDGDLDIAVAAFGKHLTGGVFVLRNESPKSEPKNSEKAEPTSPTLRFVSERVVARSGAVSLIPVDGLQPGDGVGLAVAFAQEHELVSVFYPEEKIDQKGKRADYREQVLFRAPHPNWGISNLEVSDLDGDGDLDFLLAHGDTMDDGFAYKPYHGVDWLENRGEAGFAHHRVGDLYGAHRAEAVDLDSDGDLDVVASGFLPQVPVRSPKQDLRVESVIWFEKRGRGWIPWAIESNHTRHTGLTVIDVNRDGRPDIVGAINHTWEDTVSGRAAIEVWINRGPRRSAEGRP